MRSAGTPKQLEKRRRRAGQLLKSSLAPGGRAPRRSDGEFGLPRWQAYRQKGMRGLDAKPRLGRPRRLSPTEKRQLVVLYRQEWDLVGPGVELRGGRLVETRGRSVSRDGKIAPPLIKSHPKPNAALASKDLAVHRREAKHIVFRRPRGRLPTSQRRSYRARARTSSTS